MTDYCLNSLTQLECYQSIFLISLSFVVALLNLHGYIQIYRSTSNKIKFEQYVLISGVITSILMILTCIFKLVVLLDITHFLFFVIFIFITRRFIKVCSEVEGLKISNVFFFVANSFNILLLILSLSLASIGILEELEIYSFDPLVTSIMFYSVNYGNKAFSIVIASILLKYGIKLIRSLESEYKENVEDEYLDKIEYNAFEQSNNIGMSQLLKHSSLNKLINTKEIYIKKRM